jgi:hypothetical protein
MVPPGKEFHAANHNGEKGKTAPAGDCADK